MITPIGHTWPERPCSHRARSRAACRRICTEAKSSPASTEGWGCTASALTLLDPSEEHIALGHESQALLTVACTALRSGFREQDRDFASFSPKSPKREDATMGAFCLGMLAALLPSAGVFGWMIWKYG